ncbi:MAG: alkaline phosphatase family protein [Candidatus Brockarchaeota archaeon]|nr:alkaline phosphatase family protein [Candidatus Brockarchaeota archaeon]
MTVVVFLLDGCRADALAKAKAGNILGLMEEGVVAKRCRTVYPSLTGPGHVSILTGAYPERTGIVGHFYWDRKSRKILDIFSDKYCMSKTVLELLTEHGMEGASFGSYMGRGSADGRFRRAAKKSASWISGRKSLMGMIERSPSIYKFLRGFAVGRYSGFERDFQKGGHDMYYVAFNEVDKAGHVHGPESPEYFEAIKECDEKVGEAIQVAEKAGREVTVVVTSDHGQTSVREKLGLGALSLEEAGYGMDGSVDVSGARIITYKKGGETAVAAVVSRHVQIWLSRPGDAADVAELLEGRKGIEHVILKEEAKADHLAHERLGDVSFCLAPGYGFEFLPNCVKGDHGGIDPADMEVPLVIYKKGVGHFEIGEASTVDVAPTLLHVLGIPPAGQMQGRVLLRT